MIYLIRKSFLKNAAAVSAVSLIMSTVGIFFRTYVSNRVGAEVLGLLQLVLSVYYPACTLASSGVYVASTRLCAEALARKDRSVKKILNNCLLYGILFGAGTFVLLFFGAEGIARHWLHCPQAETPLKILAFALPFLSAANSLQGFFLSLRKATYSTILQVTEDLSKIGGTVLLFTLFLDRGPNAALCALVAGMALGEISSCIFGYWLYLKKASSLNNPNTPAKNLFSEVAKIALPCAFSAYIRSGIGMVEGILVPQGLKASGLTQEQALSAIGKLEGMAIPVILFPAALLAVVSKLLVPEITAENAIGHKDDNKKTTESVLQWTLTYAMFVCVFVLLFGKELGLALYSDGTCGTYIMLLAPIVPILYCDRVTDGIMKGYNRQLDTMKINLAESILQTAGALFILPHTGICGYFALFCSGAAFNFILSFRSLKRECGIRFPFRKGVLIPMTAALAAMLPLKIFAKLAKGSVLLIGALSIPMFLLFLYGLTDRKRHKKFILPYP